MTENTYQKRVFGTQIQSVNFSGLRQEAKEQAKSAQAMSMTAERAFDIGERAYISEIRQSAATQIRESYDRNPTDPDTLQKELQVIKSSLTTDYTSFGHLQRSGQEYFDRVAEPYLNRTRDNLKRFQTQQDQTVTMQNIEMGLTEISENARLAYNLDGTVNMDSFDRIALSMEEVLGEANRVGVDGQFLLSPSQRVAYQEKGMEIVAQGAIEGMMERGQSATQLLKSWNRDGISFDINGEKMSLKDPLTVESRRQMKRFLEQKSNEEVREYERSLKEQEKEQENLNQLLLGQSFANGTSLFNPAINDHKKAYDAYFETLLGGMAQASPEQQISVIADTVVNAGYMPTMLKGIVRSAGRGDSPERMQQAAALLQEIRLRDGEQVLTDVSEGDLARIEMFNEKVQAGFTPEKAIEFLQKESSYFRKDLVEKRRKEIANMEINPIKQVTPNVFQNALRRVLPSVQAFSLDEDNLLNKQTVEEVGKAYETSFRTYYLETGDEDLAHKHAKGMVKGQFKETKVNGFNQLMRYAPESTLGDLQSLDNASEIIRQQVIKDARAIVGTTLDGSLVDENILLVANPEITPRTYKEGQPVYDIYQVLADGTMDRLTDNPVYKTEGQFFSLDRQELFNEKKKQVQKTRGILSTIKDAVNVMGGDSDALN